MRRPMLTLLAGAVFGVLVPLLHSGDAVPAAASPLRVLFIGNSYTFVNNLPAVLENLAAANPAVRPLRATMIAFGGATLEAHWQKGDARRALQNGRWDYVILQEQSILPMVQPDRLLRLGRLFNTLIAPTGAKTILFDTWARAEQPEMQEPLDRAYRNLAKDVGARLAPVGPAWHNALGGWKRPALHQEDGSHPTMLGTYLSASVLYCVIYGRPPEHRPAGLAEVAPADAESMHQIVWQTVQEQ